MFMKYTQTTKLRITICGLESVVVMWGLNPQHSVK